MQPYPNPNYYAQYTQPQPQYNPYIDRMAQLQQFQQSLQPIQTVQSTFTPLGKIVENIDVLKTTEIPMDGNAYYFPKADGSEIYSKQWLENGQTRISTFKMVSDAEGNNSTDEVLKSQITLSDELTDAFMKRFDDLQKQIEELSAKSTSKSTTSRTKKEVEDD